MINLLPEKEKKELKKIENHRKICLILLFILIAVLFLIFLSCFLKLYFAAKAEEINRLLSDRQQTLISSNLGGFQRRVGAINRSLSKIGQFYQSQVFTSSVFEKIASILPDSIYLTNFSFQKKYKQKDKKVNIVNNIYISGWAKNRDDLSLFKDRLESLKGFEKVYFLPKSWVKPNNIDFSLSLEYRP